MSEDIILGNHNGQPTATSREVAEHFGKNHRDVLESIRNLAAENSAATKSMFYETTFENRGKSYPMYEMNRDGFTLLAMGFTGKKALEWKLKYIQAFNDMEELLKVREIQAAMPKMDARMMEAQARMNNSRMGIAKMLLQLGDKAALSYCREECYQYALCVLTGKQIDVDALPIGRLFYLK